MILGDQGKRPTIADGAYVAPNAVIRGEVTIGDGAAILFGAVITAEGGPVRIGEECVIMEQAVLRGTPRAPLTLGDRTLVGPHAHVTGCTIGEDCFLATGSAVFNGATLGPGTEVRIHGVVHVNTCLPASSTVPIGWVAVGDPAEILPASDHETIWAIQKGLDFPGTVFRVDRSVPKGERTRRYAEALQRQRADELLDGSRGRRPPVDPRQRRSKST